LAKVQEAVGNYPVGYRFLADEWLPNGLQLNESKQFAKILVDAGIAYISAVTRQSTMAILTLRLVSVIRTGRHRKIG
jgi:hypothetical protein